MRGNVSPILRGALVMAGVLSWTLAAPDALGARNKRVRRGGTAIRAEGDISTAVDGAVLRNGTAWWGVDRPGPMAAAALVVRAGNRQEDVGRSGVALATARWVLASADPAALLRMGVTVEVEMVPGAAAFVLRGPADALRGAIPRLLRAAVAPRPEHLGTSRMTAALEMRRYDLRRTLPDLASALCWPGSSFELPTWGDADAEINMDDERFQRLFHRTWYRPRAITLIVVGPGGGRPYERVLKAISRTRIARGAVAPGEPGLPVHQVQGAPHALTLAGAALPGPATPGPALLVRGYAEESLSAAQAAGRLRAPFAVETLWTRKASVVVAAAYHPHSTELDADAQAQALRVLEEALATAADLSPEEVQALRKREGARLSARFATVDGALALLLPLASVVDAPPDLRREVMGYPQEPMAAALATLRDNGNRLTLRRNPRQER